MAVSTRIEPLSKDISLLIDESLSPRAQAKAVATFARQELREAQTINARALGRTPKHRTWVDGRAEAPLESVKPDGGRIVFEFEILVDVLIFIAQTLYAKSPVLTGRYRESHQLYADGVLVTTGAQLAPQAERYTFMSTVPYARKIEAGKMRMKVPGSSHVYEQTRQIASRRFGNVAKIGFTYQALAGRDRVPALTVTPR